MIKSETKAIIVAITISFLAMANVLHKKQIDYSQRGAGIPSVKCVKQDNFIFCTNTETGKNYFREMEIAKKIKENEKNT